eukprot:gene6794-49205_t
MHHPVPQGDTRCAVTVPDGPAGGDAGVDVSAHVAATPLPQPHPKDTKGVGVVAGLHCVALTTH